MSTIPKHRLGSPKTPNRLRIDEGRKGDRVELTVRRKSRTPRFVGKAETTTPPPLGKPTFVVLSLLFLGLSGCFGSPLALDPSGAPSSNPQVLAAKASDGTCGLEGLVTDESLEPISNALVVLENTPYSALTSPQGAFAFDYLPPKTYRVSTHPRGFDPAARSVTCEPDEVIEGILLQLNAIPNYNLKYHASHYARGKIGCGVGLLVQTDDLCGKKVVPDANNTLYFRLDRWANATGAVYELRWVRTHALGSDFLMFGMWIPDTKSVVSACSPDTVVRGSTHAWAKSPGCARIDPSPLYGVVYRAGEKPPTWQVRVHPVSNYTLNPVQDRTSKLVYDQPFEFVLTLFYNGLVAPEGYSYFNDTEEQKGAGPAL